jgi:hypothetical protein
MAAKKKTKNSKKTKKRSGKKSTTNKKRLRKKKSAKKSTKKAVLKKALKKRRAPKKKVIAKKKAARRRPVASSAPFLRDARVSSAGEQSGDLQGLSHRESADSESVDELLEEGNAYEAEVVQGVEDAGDDAEREVHTHEVPEDDVPEEYLDKD